jgi:hypothetical protein
MIKEKAVEDNEVPAAKVMGPRGTKKITIKDFDIQGVLGEGSFGKVYCAL